MKKVIWVWVWVWLALLGAANVFAVTAPDGKSDVLLGALGRKVASWGDYRVEFSVNIDGQALAGSYEVSGESYLVRTPEIVLFCDGTTKWEVNLPAEEVVIDSVDELDRTVLANPTRLFDFLDGSYTHRYVGPALVEGVNCERIEIEEKTADAGVGVASGDGQKIDVFISKATGLPVRLDYRIGMLNTDATIAVVRITPHIVVDRKAFTFDAGHWPDFEIIDFR